MARRTRLAVALAAASAASVAFAAGAVGLANVAFAESLYSDDFQDGDSTGWTTSGGSWSVASGVYRQYGTSSDARARAGSATWTDYTVTATVRPTAFNGSNRFVALLARTRSATSYYYVALRSNNTVELKKLVNGSATTLASGSVSVAAGTAYTLSLQVSGSALRSTVNGGTALTATDTQYAAGGIGVATYYAAADVDDVAVESGGSTSTPTPTASAMASPTVSPTTPPPSNTLIVATNGNDANPGTLSQPLATLARAVELATPGTSILLRGGTYAPAANIRIMKDGTASNPYTIAPYNGEKVVLDGENMPHTPAPVDGSIPNLERGVLHIEADFWRVVDIEIVNGPYAIFCRDCNNNIFDRLITRDNYESGLHIQAASSNNQVINLDSYGNRDPRNNGESADGLAIKEGSGTGNMVRGARLWNNSDDGLDFWEFLSPVTVENSLAWGNGFNRWNLPNYTGDGNGFKLGGGDEDLPAAHVVRNSMAWDNAVGGFIDNANPGAMVLDRNTAWRNGGTGFDVADSVSTLTRNLSVGNGTAVSMGSSTGSGNSWDIGGGWPLVSTDPSVITGPRTPSGGIPSSTFLRPANGADVGARF